MRSEHVAGWICWALSVVVGLGFAVALSYAVTPPGLAH